MDEWRYRAVPIKFQLSDWTLFSLPLRVHERALSPTAEDPPVQTPEFPAVPLAPNAQGYLLRCVPIAAELPRISAMGQYLRYVPLQYQHGYIDLRMSFAEYQRRFSAKSRSTMNRKLHRYADHCGGTIPWRTYRTPGEMDRFFALVRLLSKRTYQEKLLDAGIPESDAFIAQARTLAAQDKVRAYILFDGERPVSYLYCPVIDDVVLYRYLGFDPDYFHWSVGTVLLRLVIEQLFTERRFRCFDFTEGQSEQKRRFATHERRCANVFMIKRSARNTALILGHCLMEDCSRWMGTTLDRIGAKHRVKRLLRVGVPARRSAFAGQPAVASGQTRREH